jgi:putative ABC transport system permease protein
MSLQTLAQDFGYGARTLGRSPGFTVVAVLVLALGLGATTAIFSLFNAVMLRPLPFFEPDRLVVLWEDFSALGGPARVEAAPATYVAWEERAQSFEAMAALVGLTYNLTGEGEPERLPGTRATTNLFSLLGMQPIVGRTFSPDDEGPESVPVAIISEDLWIRRFGADPGIVGRTIRLDGLSRTIIGVVPSDFRFPNSEVAVWVPAAFSPQELAQRSAYFYYVVARLERGTSLSEAQAEMTVIARALQQDTTGGAEALDGGAPGIGATVASLQEHLSRPARPMLRILLVAVGAVLLITCANVANLLLARGTERRRELAVRKALGAGDTRIVRQLVTESAVLAVLGVVVGGALAMLSFDFMARLMPSSYPQGAGPGLDWRVLSFTAAIALLAVLLFGAGPALAVSRVDLSEALKKGVGAVATRGSRIRNGLVIGEVALTVVLLAATGLLLRSYTQVLAVDPGFRTDNLLIAVTPLSPSRYGELETRSAFYRGVLERVNTLPGVSGAGFVTFPPLVFDGGRSLITIDGRPAPPPEELANNITSSRIITPGYLPALGVPLIRGRLLDERDAPNAPLTVIINQAMAQMHWPGENPIGARLRIGMTEAGNPLYTVVGIVGDVRQMGLDVPPAPEVYYSFAQAPNDGPFYWPSHLVVRTQADPMALAEAVRDAVWAVDPTQPVSNLRTMDDVLDAELASRDMQLTLIGGFGALALLLASIGLYGVLSYTVAQRASEIGLRMALGAERGRVVRAVIGHALGLAGIGLVLGIAGALSLAWLLASFLFGVSPQDPATHAGIAGLLLLVTILAGYVPARRAAAVDPMATLRAE